MAQGNFGAHGIPAVYIRHTSAELHVFRKEESPLLSAARPPQAAKHVQVQVHQPGGRLRHQDIS
jgi:hypothetical protein